MPVRLVSVTRYWPGTSSAVPTILEAVTRFDQSARSELIVAEAYGVAGDADRATLHIKKALALDASCAGTVASSLAFKPVRQTQGVKALLADYGIR